MGDTPVSTSEGWGEVEEDAIEVPLLLVVDDDVTNVGIDNEPVGNDDDDARE
jgi:hypothetical protein